MRRRYLNSLIDDNNEEISRIGKTSGKKESKLGVAALLLTILGGIVLCGSAAVGIPILGAGISIFSARNKSIKRKEAEIARLNAENDHLRSVESNGIDARTETNQRRQERLSALETEAREEKATLDACRKRNRRIAIGIGVAAAAGLIFGGLAIWAAPVLAFVKFRRDKETALRQKHYEGTLTKINNIKNDVNIINYSTNNGGNQPQQQTNNNQQQPGRRFRLRRRYTPQQVRTVNNYVNSQANPQPAPQQGGPRLVRR